MAITSCCLSSSASAYYLVYNPTIEYGETEIEFYSHQVSDADAAVDGEQQYVLEFARAFTPEFFFEAKVEMEKAPNEDLETESVSIYGIFKITDQGEYSWAVSLLNEIEYSVADEQLAAFAFGPLLATEIGSNMTLTTNLIAEYEKEERKVEASANAQLKWRLRRHFESAIEVYANEYSKNIGPVILGKINTESAKFGYQLGWLIGMDDESADNTFKFMVEYEF